MPPIDKDSHILWESYITHQLNEVSDSKRNREALKTAYGLRDDRQAKEMINHWNKYESLISDDPDMFGFPRNVRNLNPKDIFAWSRVAKQQGEEPSVARGNLLSMIENLKLIYSNRDKQRQQQDDYDIMFKSENLTVFKPNSEGASCKLGAGTKWCTAATKSKNMFDDYTKKKGVTLYYLHTKHEGKYALAVHPSGEMEAFDEEDNQVRIDDLQQTVRDHGADLSKIVPMPSPYDPLKNMCDRLINNTKKKFADESDVMDMDQLGDDILWKCNELIRADIKGFQQFRQDTNYPDLALLAFKGQYHYHTDSGDISDSNNEIISQFAMKYFTSGVTNPAGSSPETNKLFQRQVEETVLAHTDTVIRNISKTNDKEINQILARDIEHAFNSGPDTNVSEMLVNYSKRHLQSTWSSLHDFTLDLIMERPDAVVGNTISIQLLMFTMREKNGRWMDLEKLVKSEIKNHSRQGWTEENHRILRLSEFYNRMVAGILGEPEITKYLPTFSDTVGNK